MAEKAYSNDLNLELWDGVDMNVDNQGFVIEPQSYFMWSVELTGDTDDSGGIYIFLFAPDNKTHFISFWDTNINGVLQQLEEQNIIIVWEKEI